MHGVTYPSMSQPIVPDVVFLTSSHMTELRKQKNMQTVAREIPNLNPHQVFVDLTPIPVAKKITRKQQGVYVFIKFYILGLGPGPGPWDVKLMNPEAPSSPTSRAPLQRHQSSDRPTRRHLPPFGRGVGPKSPVIYSRVK